MIPLVLVCAAPRTGTNHLCDILGGFERLKVRTEVFARDVAFSMSQEDFAALEAETGCRLPRTEAGGYHQAAPTTTQLVYDEPFATISALWKTKRPEHNALSIKLFGYHLPRGVTNELFKLGAVPVIVKRRAIDSYASKLKAQALQQWILRDTTYVPVTADIADFRYWYGRHRAWYDYLREMAPDAPVLTYEDHIVPGVEALVEHCRAVVPFDLGDWTERQGLRVQDRSASVADKIRNWDEFSAALEAEGMLDDAMGYF